MPHPLFSSIKNRRMAEACNEIFEGGEYLHIFSKDAAARMDPQRLKLDSFDLLSVQATYLRKRLRGLKVVSDFALFATSADLDNLSDMSTLYEGSVGSHQKGIFAGMGILDSLRTWYADRCVSYNKSLLIAHLLGRPAGEQVLIDLITVPRVVAEETALRLRDGIVSVLPKVDEGVRDLLQPALQDPVHNPALIELAGASAACNFLCSPEEFESKLFNHMSSSQ